MFLWCALHRREERQLKRLMESSKHDTVATSRQQKISDNTTPNVCGSLANRVTTALCWEFYRSLATWAACAISSENHQRESMNWIYPKGDQRSTGTDRWKRAFGVSESVANRGSFETHQTTVMCWAHHRPNPSSSKSFAAVLEMTCLVTHAGWSL